MKRAIAGIIGWRGDSGSAERALDAALAGAEPARWLAGGAAVAASPGPPIQPGEGGIVCVLDGHVDNALELASELELSASAPTERVLAEGFHRWGEALLARLFGDFALFLWNTQTQSGVLARDQIGARSLFVHDSGSELLFATDIRHLLPMLASTPSPDDLGMLEFVVPDIDRPTPGRTMYRGIKELLAAHAIRVRLGHSTTFCYWSPAIQPLLHGTPDELAATVADTVHRAVTRRLAPDGLTGISMSGGLDSTAVAGVAANTSHPVRCYSARLPDHPYEDESVWIDRMLEARSLSGTSVRVVGQGMLAAGLDSLQAWRVPPRSTTEFLRYPIARAAADDRAHMLIGGDGGDETFLVRTGLIADRLRRGRIWSALGLVRSLPAAGDNPPWSIVLRALWFYGANAFLPRPLVERDRRAGYLEHRWLRPERALEILEQGRPHLWRDNPGPRWWANAMDYATVHWRFHMFSELRHTADRAGVDMRFPLLDRELVELMLRVPPEYSFDPHRNRPLFRLAMKGSMPDEVRLRAPKTVFNHVHVDSMAGPDWPTVDRLLTAKDAYIGAYVDLTRVRALIDQGRPAISRGERPSIRWVDDLWRLAMAECWLRDLADPRFSSELLTAALASAA